MDRTQSEREPQQLRDLRAQVDLALADAIMARPDVCPPAPVEPGRVIRTSPENVEAAICRALARAVVWRELWRVEVAG
jgi:hypothetical protein